MVLKRVHYRPSNTQTWRLKGLFLDTVLKMLLGHVVRSTLHKNGSKHPMLQISMADNMISYKKIQRNAQKTKITVFVNLAPEHRNDEKLPKKTEHSMAI